MTGTSKCSKKYILYYICITLRHLTGGKSIKQDWLNHKVAC